MTATVSLAFMNRGRRVEYECLLVMGVLQVRVAIEEGTKIKGARCRLD